MTAPVPWTFRRLYTLLDAAVDPGTWWPADTDFEIGIGAILTQNTAWVNVEQAISKLRRADLLNPTGIAATALDELKSLIRPAGFMNAKATYLKNYTTWYLANHAVSEQVAKKHLRNNLLAVGGVGPESSDVLLRYANPRPVLIWDTYERRMLSNAGYSLPKGYETTRRHLATAERQAKFTTTEQQRF